MVLGVVWAMGEVPLVVSMVVDVAQPQLRLQLEQQGFRGRHWQVNRLNPV